MSVISPRLVATDLDGTLNPLDDDKDNLVALTQLRRLLDASNVTLVFVTGRHIESVEEVIRQFDLPRPDWIICDVGTTLCRYSGPDACPQSVLPISPLHPITHTTEQMRPMARQFIYHMSGLSKAYGAKKVLEKLAEVADSLPQVLRIGSGDAASVDYLRIAQEIIGQSDAALFSQEDMEAIRARLGEINARIAERQDEIDSLLREDGTRPERVVADTGTQGEDLVEEIRQSVSDEAIDERLSEAREAEPESREPGFDAPPPAGQPYTGPQDPPLPPWSQGPGTFEGGR
jgi:hypothetical protein